MMFASDRTLLIQSQADFNHYSVGSLALFELFTGSLNYLILQIIELNHGRF